MYLILMGQDIDRQHLRPPVLAILLETIERKIFDITSLVSTPSIFLPFKKLHYTDTIQ